MTTTAEKRRDRTGWWATAALFALLALLVAARAWVVDRTIGTYIACPGCFHVDVVLADLLAFTVLASLLLLGSSLRPAILARFARLLCGGLVLVHAADVVVFRLFNSRLLMSDVALFLPEGAAVWDQFTSGLGLPVAVSILFGFAALFLLLWRMPAVRTRAYRLVMSVILGISLAASAVFEGAPYVNDWAVENVFVANLSTPSRNRYSAEFANRILGAPEQVVHWREEGGPPSRSRNVILLILESWSVWHSALFGGFEDWTPRLDAAARRGLRFDNFHSIGFATDKGLVGILAGQQIWAPFLHWFETPPFHSMWGIEDNLPAAFNGRGYHTAFLTPGPLDLHRKGAWMEDLGFAQVEGNEHPFYQGWPRYAFDSAPDRAMYQRALEWMDEAPSPWMLTLETVTTHQPYSDPDSGERSLQLAMGYADREFGRFLDALDADGFFDDSVLIVVSDHRSMTPMSRQELDRWGPAAHSLIPAFIIAAEFAPGSVDHAVYSQSDLVPSFEWWASGETRLRPFEAVMLDRAFESSKCAFHERSDRRGLVEVTCDQGRGQILLDGDHTRFAGPTDLHPDLQQQALEVLARQRLEAWQRHLATAND